MDEILIAQQLRASTGYIFFILVFQGMVFGEDLGRIVIVAKVWAVIAFLVFVLAYIVYRPNRFTRKHYWSTTIALQTLGFLAVLEFIIFI